jgi:hypothetical protein
MHTNECAALYEKTKQRMDLLEETPPVVVVDICGEAWQLHKNLWTMLPSLPSWSSTLADVTACWVPGGFVVSGGFDYAKQCRVSDVHMYNADTKKWERLSPLSTTRADHSAAFSKGSMFVIGGTTDSGRNGEKVERYDFHTREWVRVADFGISLREDDGLPTQILAPYMADVNDRLYVLGGHDQITIGLLKGVFWYNDVNDRWERGADMPDVNEKGGCAVLNSDIYIVGGITGQSMRYNTDTDQWTIIPEPNFSSCWKYGGAFELLGTIVAIEKDFNYLEQFDPVEGKWLEEYNFPFGKPKCRNKQDADSAEINDPNIFEAISAAFKL